MLLKPFVCTNLEAEVPVALLLSTPHPVRGGPDCSQYRPHSFSLSYESSRHIADLTRDEGCRIVCMN